TGCRLMTDRPVERGQSFRLQIPNGVAGGRALAVEARVIECVSSPDPALGRFVASASFAEVDARLHAQLSAIVAAHAEGPAVCAGAPPLAAPAHAVEAVAAALSETGTGSAAGAPS